MPLVIVQEAGTLAELTSGLLRPRTGRAVRARVVDAIAAANPGLDVHALQPGQVVLVPDVPEVRLPRRQDAPSTADVTAPVSEGLERLRAALEADTKRAQAERAEVEQVAGSPEVKKLVGRLPEVRRQLAEAVKATLEQSAADDQDREALDAAMRGWLADLQRLRD